MIDEINQIGNVNSLNDLLDFKFSVKTLALLAFLAGCAYLVFVIILFGGVNNTIDYISVLIETTKNSINKPKVTKKSTVPGIIADIGIANRGKYTFVRRT